MDCAAASVIFRSAWRLTALRATRLARTPRLLEMIVWCVAWWPSFLWRICGSLPRSEARSVSRKESMAISWTIFSWIAVVPCVLWSRKLKKWEWKRRLEIQWRGPKLGIACGIQRPFKNRTKLHSLASKFAYSSFFFILRALDFISTFRNLLFTRSFDVRGAFYKYMYLSCFNLYLWSRCSYELSKDTDIIIHLYRLTVKTVFVIESSWYTVEFRRPSTEGRGISRLRVPKCNIQLLLLSWSYNIEP